MTVDRAAPAAGDPDRVDRRWLLDASAGWWRGSAKVLLVVGPPGTGKTDLVRRLSAGPGGGDATPVPVTAVHLSGVEGVPATAHAVLEHLANQLLAVAGYGREMRALYRKHDNQSINIVFRRVAAGATVTAIEHLHISPRQSVSALIEDLLTNPFRALRAAGEVPPEGVVIAVDAFDETSGGFGDADLSIPLLAAMRHIEGVRLIATTRQRPARPPGHVTVVDLDVPAGTHDVGEYLRHRLADLDPGRRDRLIALSGANLLVARYLAESVDLLPLDALEQLSGRLEARDSVYRHLLDRQVLVHGGGRQGWELRFRKALGLVAQARGATGMPRAVVEEALATEYRDEDLGPSLQEIIGACGPLLRVTDDLTEAMRPYHLSFQQYLVSEEGIRPAPGRPAIRPADMNRAIARALTGWWRLLRAGRATPEQRRAGVEPYLFAYLLDHLTDAVRGHVAQDPADLLPTRPVALAYEIAARHGVGRLLAQLDGLSEALGSEYREIRLLDVALGLQARNLVDWRPDQLAGRFLQQLLVQARVLGDEALAGQLADELADRQLDALAVAWATGGHDSLPPVHVLDHGGRPVPTATTITGDVVATGTADGVVRIWSLADGSLARSMRAGAQPLRAMAVTAAQELLVAAGDERVGYVWNPRTGHPLPTRRFDQAVRMLAAVPGGDLVVVGGYTMAWVWRATDGSGTLLPSPGGAGQVVAVAAGPAGEAVVAYSGGLVRRFDPGSGALLGELVTGEPARCAALSPDGRLLGIGGAGGSAAVLDLRRPDDGGERLAVADRASVTAAATGTALWQVPAIVYGGRDGSVSLWNMANGRQVWRRWGPDPRPGGEPEEAEAGSRSSTAHRGEVTTTMVAGRPGYVMTGGRDGRARVWQVRGGDCRYALRCDGPVTAVARSQDGQYVMAATERGNVPVWRILIDDRLHPKRGHDGPVTAAARVAEGFVTGSADGTLRAWRRDTGEVCWEGRHAAAVSAMAATDDQRRVVSGSADRSVAVWDARSGERLDVLGGHDDAVTAVAYHPRSGPVSAGRDGTVRVWTGERRRLDAGAPVERMVLTPDGAIAVTSQSDRSVAVWRLRAGRLVDRFDGHLMTAAGLAVSSDGRFAAVGFLDGEILVTDLHTGDRVFHTARLRPTRRLSCVGFVGGGRYLLAGYRDDCAVVIMPVADQVAPRHLPPGHAPVVLVRELDRHHFLTGSSGGDVVLWRLAGNGHDPRPRAHLSLDSAVTCLTGGPGIDAPVLIGTTSGDVACVTCR